MKTYILPILVITSVPSVALASTTSAKSKAGPWTDIELSMGGGNEATRDRCKAYFYDDVIDINLNRRTSGPDAIYACMAHELHWLDEHQVARPIADLRLVIDERNFANTGSSDVEICQALGGDYYQVGGFNLRQDGVGVEHRNGDLNGGTWDHWGDDYVYLCAYQPDDSPYILDKIHVTASDDAQAAKDLCVSDTYVSVPGHANDWHPMTWVDLNHDVGGDFIYMCRSRVGRDTIGLEPRRDYGVNDEEWWFEIPTPVPVGHNIDDHVRLDAYAFDNRSSFTLAMALELEPVPASHNVRTFLSISRHDHNNHLILEYHNSDQTLRLTLQGTQYVLGTVPLAPGHKFTVAVTKSGNSVSAYVDGALVGSASVGAFMLDPIDDGIVGEVLIGQEQDTMGGGFDPNQSLGGRVYSASVYGVALSPARVSAAQGRWRAGGGSGTTMNLPFVSGTSGIGWTEMDDGVSGDWSWDYFPFDWGPQGWGLWQHNNAGAYGPVALDGHTPWLGTGQVSDLWMDEGRFSVEVYNSDDDGVGVLYGYRDDANYYRAEIYGLTGDTRITRVVDGEYELLGTGSCPSLPLMYTVDLGVEVSRAQDGTVDHILQIHGQTCAIANEDEYSGGGVGVWTAWNEQTIFRFFQMSSYPSVETIVDVHEDGISYDYVTGERTIGDNGWDAVQLDARAFVELRDFDFGCQVRLDGLQTGGSYPANTLLSCANPDEDNALTYWYEAPSNLFRVRVGGDEGTVDISPPQWVTDALMDGEYHTWGLSRTYSTLTATFDGIEFGYGWPASVRIDSSVCVIGQDQDCDGGCFDGTQSLHGSVDGCFLDRR